jgi:hypothetical protein
MILISVVGSIVLTILANLVLRWLTVPTDRADCPHPLARKVMRRHGHDFDFTGAVFDGGSFAGTRFTGGKVSFASAQFVAGSVDFDGQPRSSRLL